MQSNLTKLMLQPVSRNESAGFQLTMRKVAAIALKDIRSELRTKEALGSMASFSVLAVIVFGLAFDLRVPDSDMVVPGVLWVVMMFAGVLGLNRTFGSEVEQRTLEALLLAPMDRNAIFFGKLIGNFAMMLSIQFLVLPTILIIYDVNLFHPWILVGLGVGVLGYVLVGSLFAALTAGVRGRETLLPIMILPIMVPLFLAGVSLTANVVDGRPFSDYRHWIGMLVLYDVVFGLISILLFDLIWDEG